MHIVILGGNGRTGRHAVDEALRRGNLGPNVLLAFRQLMADIGHTVTALLRSPEKLRARDGLTVVKGSPLDGGDVEAAFTAPKEDLPAAVIVALNAVRTSDNPWAAVASPPHMLADSNANVLASMKKFGVRKLVTMSAFGVADSWSNMSWLMRAIIACSNIAVQYKDHGLVDKEVKESNVDYVIVRPVMLKDGDGKPVKLCGNDGTKGAGLTSTISRKSVAIFMVDATEKSDWDKTTPVVTN